MKLHTANEKYPAEASQANGTWTYMMRTVSPCCQSDGAKNTPQIRPTMVSRHTRPIQPWQNPAGQPQKLAGIGEAMQHMPRTGRGSG